MHATIEKMGNAIPQYEPCGSYDYHFNAMLVYIRKVELSYSDWIHCRSYSPRQPGWPAMPKLPRLAAQQPRKTRASWPWPAGLVVKTLGTASAGSQVPLPAIEDSPHTLSTSTMSQPTIGASEILSNRL